MSVAQLRGVALYSHTSWRRALAEAKKDMGLGSGLLDSVSVGGSRSENKVVKMERPAEAKAAPEQPIDFRDLMRFSVEV